MIREIEDEKKGISKPMMSGLTVFLRRYLYLSTHACSSSLFLSLSLHRFSMHLRAQGSGDKNASHPLLTGTIERDDREREDHGESLSEKRKVAEKITETKPGVYKSQ